MKVKPKIIRKKKPVESEEAEKPVVTKPEAEKPVETEPVEATAKVKDYATITWTNMSGETSTVHVDVHGLEGEVKKILGRATKFTVIK